MKDPNAIEEQAAQLARWLDEHPGAQPPEGVEPDVLEAIYALRPDLAPAPSFSIDDILADVTTGPFARGGASAPPSEPAVVDLAVERRRRRPWLWTGVGAMAAAAMALFVVMPFIDSGVPDLVQMAEQAEPSVPTASPAVDATTIAEAAQPLAEDQRELKQDRIADELGVLEPEATEELPPAGGMASHVRPRTLATGSGRAKDSERAQLESDGRSESAAGPGLAGGTTAAPSAQQPAPGWYSTSTTTPDDASSSRQAAAPEAEARPSPDPAPVASPDVASATASVEEGEATVVLREREREAAKRAEDKEESSGSFFDFGLDDLAEVFSGEEPREEEEAHEPDMADMADMPVAAAPAGDMVPAEPATVADLDAYDDYDDDFTEVEDLDAGASYERRSAERSTRNASVVAKRRRGASFGGARSPERSKPSSRRADAAAAEALPAAPAEIPEIGLDELRAQANPLDYASDWYRTDPVLDASTRDQLAHAYAEVQDAIVAGDTGAALAVLEPLRASAHPRVVQDATFHVATLQLQSGQLGNALATVSAGLAASSSSTVFRSRLLALRGSILEEQGDTAGASEAYRHAAEANATRH